MQATSPKVDRGFDCVGPLDEAKAKEFRAAGYSWIGCYLAHRSDPLTLDRAQMYGRAGLYIVSICEIGFPTSATYFSAAKAKADAQMVLAAAASVKMPAGEPIYFTVDYDASNPDVAGPIEQFFDVVRLYVRKEGYILGAYGSGLVLQRLKEAGLIDRTWEAAPKGWAGYDLVSPDIRQLNNDVLVCGIRVDENQSVGNAGGWTPKT